MKTHMIRNSVKNFAVNSVYIFIPMGIIYLFVLIAIFSFVSAFTSALGGAISQLAVLIKDSAAQSGASVNEFIAYTLEELQGEGDIVEILKRLVDPQWLRSALEGFFGVLNQTSADFEQQFTGIVNNLISQTVAYIWVAVCLCAVGLSVANCVTGVAIRQRTAKRGVKKFIVAHTVVPIVQSIVLVAAVYLLSIIKLYGLLLFAVILLIMSGLSLLNAWLIHNDGTLKLKEVLTAKNILCQLAVSFLALLLNIVLAILLLMVNPLLAVLIMLPVFIYTINIADVNADSFICTVLENKRNGGGSPQA